jgi:hypothetical protein
MSGILRNWRFQSETRGREAYSSGSTLDVTGVNILSEVCAGLEAAGDSRSGDGAGRRLVGNLGVKCLMPWTVSTQTVW